MAGTADGPDIAVSKRIDLPPEVEAVFREFRTCEFSTLARGGTPIVWPTLPFWRPEEARFLITTSIGLPHKALNARRNPRVSLLFSDPTASDLMGHPAVADFLGLGHGPLPWPRHARGAVGPEHPRRESGNGRNRRADRAGGGGDRRDAGRICSLPRLLSQDVRSGKGGTGVYARYPPRAYGLPRRAPAAWSAREWQWGRAESS